MAQSVRTDLVEQANNAKKFPRSLTFDSKENRPPNNQSSKPEPTNNVASTLLSNTGQRPGPIPSNQSSSTSATYKKIASGAKDSSPGHAGKETLVNKNSTPLSPLQLNNQSERYKTTRKNLNTTTAKKTRTASGKLNARNEQSLEVNQVFTSHDVTAEFNDCKSDKSLLPQSDCDEMMAQLSVEDDDSDQTINEESKLNVSLEEENTEKGLIKCKRKKWFPPFREYKAVYPLIFVLLLLVTVLTVALIIITRNSTDDGIATKNQKCAPCDYDWIWSRGKCYYFSTIEDTWDNSQEFCKSNDSSLAFIDDQQELHLLFQFKGLENRWIGLRRTDDNKSWAWTNGTRYNETLFQIERTLDDNIEYAYLNHKNVKSQEGTTRLNWICEKDFICS